MNRPPNSLFSLRMKLQSRLRSRLEAGGYHEVITSALQEAPGSDPEIESFATGYSPLMEPDPPASVLYLHPSPEYAMKRLLCRGHKDIYQVCQVFRQGERSPWHSPEFTMAEWYRVGWTWLELMEEIEQMVVEVTEGKALVGGREIRMRTPFPRITVAAAMKEAGVDCRKWDHLPDRQWQEIFYRSFVEKMEPWLRTLGPVFLTDYPAKAAILSRTKPDDPGVAERFELIIAGVELANGCTELCDPAQHRERFEMDAAIRKARRKAALPEPEAFLQDLEDMGLPPCAGVALGVDRLAMIALGAQRIEQVQAFPFAR